MIKNKIIYEMQAGLCKALSHPLRIEVIDILRDGELCFTDILEKTGGLKSNLSQHLSVMTRSSLLKVRREGQCNYYSLASPKVTEACSLMHELLGEHLKNQKSILDLV